MNTHLIRAAAFAMISCLSSQMHATEPDSLPDIHFIWMGGNDCPPCVNWRAVELPKLKLSEEFQRIRFSYVVKAINSPIPSRFFLSSEVGPLKEKLDEASGGRSGSPKGVLIVNGTVYDFFVGTRSAEQIQSMIQAARTGEKYPFKRCLRMSPTIGGKCDLRPSNL